MRKSRIADANELPRPGEGKRGEQGYFGYLLRQAANLYQKRLGRALDDLNVTPPQFSVLTMIGAYPGASNADIARLALLTPQTVNVIVSNLERAGWISRHAHAVHGRIKQLELTREGKALLTQARKRAHAVEDELASGMSDRDADTVRRWLANVAKTLTD